MGNIEECAQIEPILPPGIKTLHPKARKGVLYLAPQLFEITSNLQLNIVARNLRGFAKFTLIAYNQEFDEPSIKLLLDKLHSEHPLIAVPELIAAEPVIFLYNLNEIDLSNLKMLMLHLSGILKKYNQRFSKAYEIIDICQTYWFPK